jgi:hypothetical protein
MRRWEQLVSLVALVIIVSGSTLAWNHEHAESNLQRWYAEDNQRFFAGQLPPVWIHFGDLSKEDADGETKHNDNTGFEIIVDRLADDKRMIVRHELCHVQTRSAEHGELFQACMSRY